MEKEEINKLIQKNNARIIKQAISATKSSMMFELDMKEKRLQTSFDNLNTNFIKIKFEVEERMKALLENMDFVKKVEEDMNKKLENRLRDILSNEEITNNIIRITKDEIKSNLSENIKTVVKQILSSISKKLRYELNITKDLCYSIDSEIKHVTRDNEISYELGKRIETRINTLLSNVKVKEGKMILLTQQNENNSISKT